MFLVTKLKSRFFGFNCSAFQRGVGVRVGVLTEADVLPVGGSKRLAKEKGAAFLLVSFVASCREVLGGSLGDLLAIAAAAASNGEGEAGGDILCNDSQKNLRTNLCQ